MIELIHGDCMDFMRDCKDNQFDLAIVDPPYGIGMSKGTFTYSKEKCISSKRNYVAKEWDNRRPSKEYFAELERVSKNQIIWGGNYFADLLLASRGWVFWDKKIINSNNINFSDGELAWTSFDRILRKFTYDWIGFGYLNNPQREKKQHPTQKPVQLYRWLLKNYAKEGDTILDTHLGSGSSAIACHIEGFDMVGIEIDHDYCKAAKKRFKEVTAQTQLF